MVRPFLSLCLSLLKSGIQIRLENVFLRKQLEIVTRTSTRLRLRPSDRFFISILTDLFGSWRESLLIIKPGTVIRWHKQGFKLYWRWKSRLTSGRPAIAQAQISLIKQMAADNPLWGAPRIHGEMLKLGFDISEATVQRYMPARLQRTTRQRWKTFLTNHSAEIISLDFFDVPTVTFTLLYVLVFLSHDRRRIIHFNVTDHPTSEWTASLLLQTRRVRSDQVTHLRRIHRWIAGNPLPRRGQCNSSERICAHFPLLHSTTLPNLPSHCTEHHAQFMIHAGIMLRTEY
jgi:putative transposase